MVSILRKQRTRVRGAPQTDTAAVRVAAVVRVATAVGVAAFGSFVANPSDDASAFFLIAGLLWAPAAIAVFYATDGRIGVTALLAGPLIDLALLGALQVTQPDLSELALVLTTVVIAIAGYTWPVHWAWGAVGIGLMVTAVAQALVPETDRAQGTTLGLFAVAVAGLLLLVERMAGERRRALTRSYDLERRGRTLLSRVADGIVVTDETGALVEWNDAAVRLLGHPVSASTPCAVALALHEAERELDCSAGCALLRASESSAESMEVWRERPDGQRQPLLASVSAVPAGDGSVEVVHSLRDITRLKQADEAKTLFLATASHELKTPLTVITGFASTLLSIEDMPLPDRRQALEAIHRRSLELTRIVDRLLLSSRIEAGRVDVTIEPIDVVGLVSERVRAFGATSGRIVRFDPRAAPPALADLSAFVTVVDHLVDNALKYSAPYGHVSVDVSYDDDVVIVEVSDNGVGMDAEQVEHCFDKFWQAESTDVRRFGGTGIGLYIVRSLVDAMRADISVASAPGEGTTFRVQLLQPHAVRTPAPRTASPTDNTIIHEFMRQIGIPSGRQQ